MKLRLPLYLRAVLLLALNLLVLAALLIAWSGWGSVLSPAARERLTAIGERVSMTLSQAPESEWPRLLDGFGNPPDIRYGSRGPKGPPGMAGPDGFPDAGNFPRPPPMPPPGADFPDHTQRVEIRSLGWWGPYRILIPQLVTTARGRAPLDVLIEVRSPIALATLLGIGEWLRVALIAIAVSALLWTPFFVGIVRAVMRMQSATAEIAHGRFDIRIAEHRRDEFGELAASINRMARRLDEFVGGQKRFLADTAHEVISPLARIQVGLGLLESRLGDEHRPALQDVQDDVQQMSELLNELLLFSRAGIETRPAPAEAVNLRQLLDEAAMHEDLQIDARAVDPALLVLAQRALLLRAISNLLRNAQRHGKAQIVEIAAQRSGDQVTLRIRDRGPGVPADALDQLGRPFFRPERSRSRDTGGYGLGLAIVRACVQACGGDVRFRNRAQGGFEAELLLQALR